MSRIAQARALRGLSGVELAEASGVAGTMISAYENARVVPRLDVLVKLADALDVDLDYLAGRRPEPRLDGPQATGILGEIQTLTTHQKRTVSRFIAFLRNQQSETPLERLRRGIAARQST